MKTIRFKFAAVLAGVALALGTTTPCQALLLLYQGRLTENNAPAVGTYEIMTTFYDAGTNGNMLLDLCSPVPVADGLFAVTIPNQPAGVFNGQALWLELAVRRAGTSNAFTLLEPRQPIGASPYAFHAECAASAGSVAFSNVVSWPTWFQPEGIAPEAITKTGATLGQVLAYDGSKVGWLDPVVRTGAVSTVQLADGAVTAAKTAPGNLLKSLNGLHDTVLLAVSGGLNLSTQGNTLLLNAPLSLSQDCNTFSNCYWSLLGNGNITPGVNFLGTVAGELDPLEFRVNNQRALRLEPAPNVVNVIAGHVNNTVLSGYYGGAIGGGSDNLITNNHAVVGGGNGNLAGGQNSLVAGGNGNIVRGGFSSVGGGLANNNAGYISTVGGGSANRIAADAGYATIAGGYGNTITNGNFGTIGGGEINIAGAPEATVGGGDQNWALGFGSTIAGGQENVIVPTADYAFVGGGYLNGAYGRGAVAVGGGIFTFGGNKAVADWSAIVGGYDNQAWGTNSFIGGGANNRALGRYSTVPGGRDNVASGLDSFAAGRRAKATNDNTFVWNDSNAGDFYSTASSQFLVHAKGGLGVNVNDPVSSGVSISSGGTTALELRQGDLKVTGAGVNTFTIVFTHRATASSVAGHITTISNHRTDGRPDAVLLITHNWSKDTATDPYETHPVGVYYDGTKWNIFHEDFAAMPVGRAFNVMVINP